jgi:hypothetical protein
MIAPKQEPYTAFRSRPDWTLRHEGPSLNDLKTENFFHQWPLRGFAFASDLGTVAKLANVPKLGMAGWAIAAPYYLASILGQKNKQQRENELIYQATANGLFPFLEAKAGVHLGGKLSQTPLFQSFFPKIAKIKPQYLQLLSGLLFVGLLTPFVGDPFSKKCLSWLSHTKLDSLSSQQKKWEA